MLILAMLALHVSAGETAPVDYDLQIRPLLSDRCYRCHGPDDETRKKKLRLDLREGIFKDLEDGIAVVHPGDTDRSELISRIMTDDDEDLMPPPKSKLTLSDSEKALILRWVAEGAEFKTLWSLNPVRNITPPSPRNEKWIRNPIDAFVLARLESEKLDPAPEAARETLLRRLAQDLTGLPPSVQELDTFLAAPPAEAYERAVDRYLDAPTYGERMATDWLDLARYADTYGYQSDVDCDLSPWRDWVIRAYNENLPYNEFITWQLAGDLLPNATRDQRLATAFNRLHRQTNEGGSIDEEFRVEYVADRLNTMGTAMLGLTLGCARCHDHKFDPIKQRDYYSLSAFFNNIDESGLYSHFTRSIPTPTLLLWPDGMEARHGQLLADIAAAELHLQEIAAEAQPAFKTWRETNSTIQVVTPLAHYDFDTLEGDASRDRIASRVAKLHDGPQHLAVRDAGEAGSHDTNFAFQFSGDNQIVCHDMGHFTRADSFSFSLRIKPTEAMDRAVVLHHSRAWSDSGSRGYELVLDHGRLFFGLIHFWPGNAIAIRGIEPLATNVWSHIIVTYDGSSRAEGIRLYGDGALIDTEIVRDNLYKDITHRAQWGDSDVGGIHLTLAARFRDNGFKNGWIDDLRVFNVALTTAEALTLSSDGPVHPSDEQWFGHYLARHHAAHRSAHADLQKRRAEENALVDDVPEIMTMQEMSPPRQTHVLRRGAYDAPADPVERGIPASLGALPPGAPQNRLGFAQWMTDRQHPLTSRVAVNRIWKMHFGRGIVATLDDFGSQGERPTHPELLDWLSAWFMEHDWDVKALHRLIVNSSTYRQSSQASPALVARDPDNLLLARGPRQRLTAEQIRDTALAASGLLNRTLGGRSVKPYQPAGLWQATGTGKTYHQDHGDKLYRRSLYTFWRRTAPPPSMLTFDALTREVCTAKRETTTTPLQALVLMNDPQFMEAARVLSERLLKSFPDDVDARTRDAYRTLIGRAPDATELKVLRQLFDEQKTFYEKEAGAAETLLATGESPWDASLPHPDFAATTMLVSTIMNFDAFITVR